MAFVLPDSTQRHVLPVHRGSQHKLHSRRQPPCRQPCRADAGTRSLEQAVRVLNKVIGIASSPLNRKRAEANQKSAKPAKPKWVAFTGGSSAKVDAPGGSGRSGRALTDYLALPVTQYSLLDESLVERLDEETFRVTVPLDTTTGVQVRPQVLISVSVDREAGCVTFSSQTATLGDPALDKEVSMQLRATLGSIDAGDRRAFRRLVRRRQPEWSPHPQQQQQGAEQAGSAADSGGGALQQQPHDPLAAAEDFRPLQAADVQQSAEVITAMAPRREAGSGHGVGEVGSSRHAAGNGAAAVPSACGAAVVDGVPVADISTSNGASIGSTDGGASASAPPPPQQQQQQQQATTEAHAGVILEAGSSAAQQLAARVDVRVTLNVPPALRVVPGPLLGYAGGLVLKVGLQALLPSFLQLLAQDYAAWSSGDRKRGSSSGSLLAAAGLDADAESDSGMQDAVPADWQQCDADGVPVADTQQAGSP